MCNITVATSESWKDKATGEKKELTEWHRISFFGKLAEICGQYLKKGSQVYSKAASARVNGPIKKARSVTPRKSRAIEMTMLGSRQGMGAPGSSGGGGGYDNEPTDYAPAPAKNKPKPSFDDLGDDIPF
jgi:single-strand DNA-binding protein